MSKRDQDPRLSSQLDRRQMLMLGASLALTASGCGNAISGNPGDLSTPDALSSGRMAANLLAGIDTVVVLMMENRSFDHVFGTINHDRLYPAAGKVNGLRGDEWNPTPDGERVTSHPLPTLLQQDTPHDWDSCHVQWNGGRNDGFVRAHAGDCQRDVMGYLQRAQLPFTYWLADNFTLCDAWHASVLGPTWPNRSVLHAGTAHGLKKCVPFILSSPRTIWEALPPGVTGKNYRAGIVACYTGVFIEKVLRGINPVVPLDDFFTDAKNGTLPNFAMIDPDFEVNDDAPPSHDVSLGQALIASVYNALAASPQWSRCLFVLTYDEHGGFYDHVPPPQCADDDPEYQRLGFRVPAIVAGPTVRRQAVCSTTFEHASVAATLRTRYGLETLTSRMAGANDLSACIDPAAVGMPRQPPANPPVVAIDRERHLWSMTQPAFHSQPGLEELIRSGRIPAAEVDPRSRGERTEAWLRAAQELGAVRFR